MHLDHLVALLNLEFHQFPDFQTDLLDQEHRLALMVQQDLHLQAALENPVYLVDQHLLEDQLDPQSLLLPCLQQCQHLHEDQEIRLDQHFQEDLYFQ